MFNGFKPESPRSIEDFLSFQSQRGRVQRISINAEGVSSHSIIHPGHRWTKQDYERANSKVYGCVVYSPVVNPKSIMYHHMSVFSVSERLLGDRRLIKPQLGRIITVDNISIVDVEVNGAFLGIPLSSLNRYSKVDNVSDYDNQKSVVATGLMAILQPEDYPEMQSNFEEFKELDWLGIQNEAKDKFSMLESIRRLSDR